MAQLFIFVSHSHTDDEFCRGLVAALRAAGADVWYDEHSLGAGRLTETIEAQLRARPVFIVILSPDSLRSHWVEDESRRAYSLWRLDPSRIILPVLAKAPADPGDIWLFLQDFKRIEAHDQTPYPLEEASARALRALALTPAGAAPGSPTLPLATSIVDLIAQGKALIGQQRYNEAIATLRTAAERDPLSYGAWFSLGLAWSVAGASDQAVAAFDRALTLDPRNANAWYNRGRALLTAGHAEEALRALDQALTFDPRHLGAWLAKGEALRSLSRYEDAEQAEWRAVELSGPANRPFVGYRLADPLALPDELLDELVAEGKRLMAERRFDEAIPVLESATQRNARIYENWVALGDAYYEGDRLNDAVAAYDRALALKASDAAVWNNKAIALWALNRPTEAIEAERQAKAQGWDAD